MTPRTEVAGHRITRKPAENEGPSEEGKLLVLAFPLVRMRWNDSTSLNLRVLLLIPLRDPPALRGKR